MENSQLNLNGWNNSMKILHTGNRDLSSHALQDNITKAIYSVGSDQIRESYNIHVNYVNNSWVIDCEASDSILPSIKLSAFIRKNGSKEVLKIVPKRLLKFPNSVILANYNSGIDICNTYIDVMDFISALYDFEFEL